MLADERVRDTLSVTNLGITIFSFFAFLSICRNQSTLCQPATCLLCLPHSVLGNGLRFARFDSAKWKGYLVAFALGVCRFPFLSFLFVRRLLDGSRLGAILTLRSRLSFTSEALSQPSFLRTSLFSPILPSSALFHSLLPKKTLRQSLESLELLATRGLRTDFSSVRYTDTLVSA